MEQQAAQENHFTRRKDEKEEVSDAQLEREEEYHAVIEPDSLLAEVGEANEKISNPSEARRVVPSKPC